MNMLVEIIVVAAILLIYRDYRRLLKDVEDRLDGLDSKIATLHPYRREK